MEIDWYFSLFLFTWKCANFVGSLISSMANTSGHFIGSIYILKLMKISCGEITWTFYGIAHTTHLSLFLKTKQKLLLSRHQLIISI